MTTWQLIKGLIRPRPSKDERIAELERSVRYWYGLAVDTSNAELAALREEEDEYEHRITAILTALEPGPPPGANPDIEETWDWNVRNECYNAAKKAAGRE